MTSTNAVRAVLAALAVTAALVLQTSVFPHLAWRGVGPNVVLLVVVAGGLARGPQAGLVLGFGAGLLLDLAPPADHVAGRWALALLLVGYVAGRVRQDAPAGLGGTLAAVVACSFLGTSVFALTGLALQDTAATVPELLGVVLAGVAWDLALVLVVLPLVALARTRSEPDGVPAR